MKPDTLGGGNALDEGIRMLGRLRCSTLPVAIVLLLSGCQSLPPNQFSVSPTSSILAVTVYFHAHRSRFLQSVSGPSLAGVLFLKAPIHGPLKDATELIPASWIKGSRAYLFDPEPGTYYVVAVSGATNVPATSTSGSLGGGVTGSVSSGGSMGGVIILPAEIVQQTRAAIGPSRVEFAGELQITGKRRVNASTEFEDELPRRMAELIRPGVTSESGLSGLLTMTSVANADSAIVFRDANDRERFLDDARADFGRSPWAEVIRSLD